MYEARAESIVRSSLASAWDSTAMIDPVRSREKVG